MKNLIRLKLQLVTAPRKGLLVAHRYGCETGLRIFVDERDAGRTLNSTCQEEWLRTLFRIGVLNDESVDSPFRTSSVTSCHKAILFSG
jgi:hypothetical protein